MKKLMLLFAVIAFCGLQSYAQRTITGKVTNDAAEGLPGVTMVVKDADVTTMTETDGFYSITLPEGSNTLIFNYPGLETQERAATGSTLNVMMKAADGTEIETVVVTAMGIEKTPDAVTSSQQIVTAENLNKGGNSSAVQALTGKVSGLQINQTNSGVVAENSIILRGRRSITGNNEALIVIDGVKSTISVFQQLPPEVVKTVNVIKGAQGAALYGSDGVNGVILVTTKGAEKREKMNIIFNSKMELDQPSYFPERQRKYGQGWDGHRIPVENGAWGPAFDDPNYKGKTVIYGVPMYDYDGSGVIETNTNNDDPYPDDAAAFREVYAPRENNVRDFFVMGRTFGSDLTIDASGKNKYVMLSLGYLDRNFVVEGDELKKYSVLFKEGITMNRWTVSGSVNYLKRKTNTTEPYLYSHLLFSSTDIPISRYKDYPDHCYGWNVYNRNPYWYIKHQRYMSNRDYISTVASLAYKLTDHINVKYIANLKNTASDYLSYRDEWKATAAYNLEVAQGMSSKLNKNNAQTTNYYGDLLISFDYDLSDDIDFNALVGTNYQDVNYKITSAGGTNLEVPGLYTINLSSS